MKKPMMRLGPAFFAAFTALVAFSLPARAADAPAAKAKAPAANAKAAPAPAPAAAAPQAAAAPEAAQPAGEATGAPPASWMQNHAGPAAFMQTHSGPASSVKPAAAPAASKAPVASKKPASWTAPKGKAHAKHAARPVKPAPHKGAAKPTQPAAKARPATKAPAAKPAAKPATKPATLSKAPAKAPAKTKPADAHDKAKETKAPAAAMPAKALKPVPKAKTPEPKGDLTDASDEVAAPSDDDSSMVGPLLLIFVLGVLGSAGGYLFWKRKQEQNGSPREDLHKDSKAETAFGSNLASLDMTGEEHTQTNAFAATSTTSGGTDPGTGSGPLGLGRGRKPAAKGEAGKPAEGGRPQHRTMVAGAASEVATTSPTGAKAKGPSEPCTFERFVELSVAQSCWAEQGSDIASNLQAHFGLSLLDWASLNAYWSQRYPADAELARRFGELEPGFKTKYGTAAA